MRKSVLTILVASTGLAACGGGGGLNRDRPDEFAVSRQAPLVIPPDYALVPPTPGAPRPQEAAASAQALQALFGGQSARSPAEAAALQRAGQDQAAAGIRSDVGDPRTAVVDKGSVTRDIVRAPEGAGQSATATAGGAIAPTPAGATVTGGTVPGQEVQATTAGAVQSDVPTTAPVPGGRARAPLPPVGESSTVPAPNASRPPITPDS